MTESGNSQDSVLRAPEQPRVGELSLRPLRDFIDLKEGTTLPTVSRNPVPIS